MKVQDCARAWFDHRERRNKDARRERLRFHKYISPAIGEMRMDDSKMKRALEKLVETLDLKVEQCDISWSTAERVWAIVTKFFGDATNAKDRNLRVLEDKPNPCFGVRGPDKGLPKEKAYLYPSEFLKLITCTDIPKTRREQYAVAVYTGLRAGELLALEEEAIDLDRGVIIVDHSMDGVGDICSTKNGRMRKISIERNLWPLLAKGLTKGDASASLGAGLLRYDLEVAGVRREALFKNDLRHKHVTFHDLRATYATWCAVRGDDPIKLQRRMGHANLDTTMIYVREAENFVEGFGEVFPSLSGLV